MEVRLSDNGTIRVLGFAGSLRRKSYNRGLIRAAAELAPEGMEITIHDLSGIPLYNADVEAQGFPEAVEQFHSAIRNADALLIATPEYQTGVPGVLKNALDWAARPPRGAPIEGKPVAIMGATPGKWGTARAQLQLRHTLIYNANPMVLKPEVLVSEAADRFNEEGDLTHAATREFIGKLLQSLAELTRRHT